MMVKKGDFDFDKMVLDSGYLMLRLCHPDPEVMLGVPYCLRSIALKRGRGSPWVCVVSAYDREDARWKVAFFSAATPGDALKAFLAATRAGKVVWKPDRYADDLGEPQTE